MVLSPKRRRGGALIYVILAPSVGIRMVVVWYEYGGT